MLTSCCDAKSGSHWSVVKRSVYVKFVACIYYWLLSLILRVLVCVYMSLNDIIEWSWFLLILWARCVMLWNVSFSASWCSPDCLKFLFFFFSSMCSRIIISLKVKFYIILLLSSNIQVAGTGVDLISPILMMCSIFYHFCICRKSLCRGQKMRYSDFLMA